MPADPIVRLRGAVIGYGRRPVVPVLDGITFDVHAREVVGLSGPSGSGKSSLLRAIAGLISPWRGAIEVSDDAGILRAARDAARRRVGLVGLISQDPLGSLDPLWSIGRSVTELAQRDPDGRAPDLGSLLARVGLEHLDARRRPHELSLGQCQRITLARVLAGSPRIILADEPTSALDPTTAARIARLLREAANDSCAVVVASHDERLLDALCSRVLRVHDRALVPAVAGATGSVERMTEPSAPPTP